ncbi:hypothetical protein B484DRAFT_453736 [Ochromonadaceae sp. CCMP2298]|nr:hypothetical protein B484DRAFT_453736 [Ochromonadaceae sp. CCMP2298]
MLPSLSGLRLSSPDVLRHQPGPSDSPSLRDCSIAVDPFGSSLNSSISVNPVVCLTCGGYISQYSELNPDGEWRCALCLSTNPRFLSSSELQSLRAPRALRQIFPELQGDHYDCVERFASPPKTKHFLFALDAPLCADVDTLDLLLHAVALLPGETMVGVMVFGRHIDLLRLGGMGTEGLASDVFPGDLDSSQKFAHMRHVYFAPARVVRSRWACVAGALSLLSVAPTRHPRAVSGPPLNRSGTSVEALVGLAVTMGGSGAGMGARVRLCILTCRALAAYNPFAGRAPFVSDEGDIRLACFRSIGRWAYAQGCSVDLFYASLGAGNFDQMDALTSASGGVVAAGSAFDEAHLRLSMQTFVRRNSSDVEHMSTLEVRCGGVQVERIVGPLLSAQDVLYHRGTTDTEGMLAVNRRHVANSVAAQCGEGSEMEEHVGRIAKHSVDLCGVNVRGDSGAFVTVTVRPTSTPTTADQAHVQIVARFVRTNAGEMELVTRVWSVRLGFTQDVPRFIAQLDAPLWVLSAARGIVADYHAEMSASDASKGNVCDV